MDKTTNPILDDYWLQTGIVTWVTVVPELVSIIINVGKNWKDWKKGEQQEVIGNCPLWTMTIAKKVFAIVRNVVVLNISGYAKYQSMPCPGICGDGICEGEIGIIAGFALFLTFSKAMSENFGFGRKTWADVGVNILSSVADTAAQMMVIVWPLTRCVPNTKVYNNWEVYGACLFYAATIVLFVPCLSFCFRKGAAIRFWLGANTFLTALLCVVALGVRGPSLPIFGTGLGIIAGLTGVFSSLVKILETVKFGNLLDTDTANVSQNHAEQQTNLQPQHHQQQQYYRPEDVALQQFQPQPQYYPYWQR